MREMFDIENTRQLTKAIKSGNREAFEQLFRAMYTRLCVYAESILHEEEEAKDVVQQVFTRLWERRSAIAVSDTWKAYLYRCTYNVSLNLLKHEKVRRHFLEFVARKEYVEECWVENLFREEQQDALIQKINRVVESFPTQCREIFLLSRFSGKKSSEIAGELNISVRTVETQLYRAMKLLKQSLSGEKREDLLLLKFFLRFCK